MLKGEILLQYVLCLSTLFKNSQRWSWGMTRKHRPVSWICTLTLIMKSQSFQLTLCWDVFDIFLGWLQNGCGGHAGVWTWSIHVLFWIEYRTGTLTFILLPYSPRYASRILNFSHPFENRIRGCVDSQTWNVELCQEQVHQISFQYLNHKDKLHYEQKLSSKVLSPHSLIIERGKIEACQQVTYPYRHAP